MAEENLGIGVGVRNGNTTNWYRAHSLARRMNNTMCVYGLDEKRTPFIIPNKEFAGVAPSPIGYDNKPYPDMMTEERMQKYRG